MIPILILAAGSSSRMRGKDKLLETVSGRPLLKLQAERAIATGAPVYVVLPDLVHPRAVCLDGLEVTRLAAPEASAGLAHSLRAGLRQLPAAKAVMITLADLVALDQEALSAVLEAVQLYPDHLIWRGATTSGMPGHPIVIAAQILPEFEQLVGDKGASAIVNSYAEKTHLTRLPGNNALLDLDTPEEWERWRSAAS